MLSLHVVEESGGRDITRLSELVANRSARKRGGCRWGPAYRHYNRQVRNGGSCDAVSEVLGIWRSAADKQVARKARHNAHRSSDLDAKLVGMRAEIWAYKTTRVREL